MQEQLLEIKFQFVTPRFRPFGERMIAKLNIVQDAQHMADVLSSRESMASVISSAKKMAAMRVVNEDAMGEDGEEVSDASITAIGRKGRKPLPSEAEMFQMACELSDQGFGDFDLCLTVLTTKKGNLKLAKNALSKVIFSN